MVLILVDHGADLNAQSVLCRTPLHRSMCVRDFEAFELLVSQGAVTKVVDSDGITMLHLL
jgi:ankyrin repeat protein